MFSSLAFSSLGWMVLKVLETCKNMELESYLWKQVELISTCFTWWWGLLLGEHFQLAHLYCQGPYVSSSSHRDAGFKLPILCSTPILQPHRFLLSSAPPVLGFSPWLGVGGLRASIYTYIWTMLAVLQTWLPVTRRDPSMKKVRMRHPDRWKGILMCG